MPIKFARFVPLALCVTAACSGFALQGCGDQRDDAQTTRGALGTFGGWQQLTGGIVPDAPALAVASGVPLTAFGLGLDSQIWVTKQDASHHWTGVWRQLSNNGGPFLDRPGAAAFDVSSGPLQRHFAIVARRADNKYYITIRDQDGGGVLLDWSLAMPNQGLTYSGPPSLAFVPAGSPTNPKATLALIGTDSFGLLRYQYNTLTNNGTVFSNQNWAGVLPVFPIPPTTVVAANALTYACPPTSAYPSLITAIRIGDGTFRYATFNGSSWLSWFLLPGSGTFHDGPALATGCGEFSREVSIYGRRTNDTISVSTQISGGPQQFTQISPDVFTGTPTAVGGTLLAHVAAVTSGQIPFSNSAASP